jgi:hypothetical protein
VQPLLLASPVPVLVLPPLPLVLVVVPLLLLRVSSPSDDTAGSPKP